MSHDRKQELISRETAINLLCKTGCDMERAHKLMLTTHEAKQWAVDVIDSVPVVGFSADAYGMWISVDDRMPDPFINVIVANKRGKRLDIDKAWWNGSYFDRHAKNGYHNVTHWMPLPESPENVEQGVDNEN